MSRKLEDKIFIALSDTVYGIFASAFCKEAIDWVYFVKNRELYKPCIILITEMSQLDIFGMKISDAQKKFLEKHWPSRLTIRLEFKNKSYLEKFLFLHSGLNSLCFRMIKKEFVSQELWNTLKKYGPVVAPSANKQGEKTVESIKEAKEIFGDNVDFYIEDDVVENKNGKENRASTIIKLNENASFEILRQGEYVL